MKKLKLLITTLLLVGISMNVSARGFGKRGGGSGLKQIVKILVAMQAKHWVRKRINRSCKPNSKSIKTNRNGNDKYVRFRKRAYNRAINEDSTGLSRVDGYSKSN